MGQGRESLLLVYNGASWIGSTPVALQNMPLLGLGATADASNPFSAKLDATLWRAKTVAQGGTGDLFYTMNKEAAGDDRGLTLQTGFVTKALMGPFGSNHFQLAVSADGSTFFDGLSVENATGFADQPRLPRFGDVSGGPVVGNAAVLEKRSVDAAVNGSGGRGANRADLAVEARRT